MQVDITNGRIQHWQGSHLVAWDRGRIVCVDLRLGEVAWTRDMPVNALCLTDGGLAVVAADERGLLALEIGSGSEVAETREFRPTPFRSGYRHVDHAGDVVLGGLIRPEMTQLFNATTWSLQQEFHCRFASISAHPVSPVSVHIMDSEASPIAFSLHHDGTLQLYRDAYCVSEWLQLAIFAPCGDRLVTVGSASRDVELCVIAYPSLRVVKRHRLPSTPWGDWKECESIIFTCDRFYHAIDPDTLGGYQLDTGELIVRKPFLHGGVSAMCLVGRTLYCLTMEGRLYVQDDPDFAIAPRACALGHLPSGPLVDQEHLITEDSFDVTDLR